MNKGFCESLLKVINKSYGNAKIFYVCKGKFENKYLKDKKICKKNRDLCHYTGECRAAANSICILKHSVPEKIPIVFHNGSNCDYHFIIKELVQEFKKIIYLLRRKH